MAGLLPALRRAARRPCRGIRALPAAALLALPLLLGPAPAAEAQTTRLLVGNQGAGTGARFPVLSNYYPAQAFTTGANSAGYSVANVEIEFWSAPSAAALGDMTLTIRNANGSNPGTVVGTLTNPGSGAVGFNTFTAPGGGIDLAASTTYFVDIRGLSGSNTLSVTTAGGTGSGNEQSGSLSGWSIADALHVFSAGTWGDRAGAALRMKINGTVKMAPAAPTGLMARAGDARVTLTWDDPDNDSITEYEYQQRTSGGSWGGWTDFTSDADTTTHTVTGLTNGTAYEFQLRAVNTSGASAASETVSATPAVPAAPAAPTGFTIDTGDTEITLKWTDPNNDAITKYQYRQGTGPLGSITWLDWTDIPASDEDTTEYKVTGLTNGTPYYFQVRAVAGTVDGTATRASAITPVAKPAAPTSLRATAGATQVTLNWADPDNDTITSYEYRQRALNPDSTLLGDWGNWMAIANSDDDTISHAVAGLTNYTQYQFQLRAVGLSGTGTASQSVGATPRPAGAPAAPRNFTSSSGDAEVDLEWADPSNSAITKYQYRQGTSSLLMITWGNWTDIPASNANTTEYTVTGLTNGTRYLFEVRAVAGTVNGVAAGYVLGTPAPAPDQPAGLSAAPGDGQVTLSWNDPSDSTIFHYFYQVRTGSSWGNIQLFGSDSTTTHTVTGLTNGTEYGFRISAANASGNSPYSAVVTATPLDASALAAPTGLTATAGDASGEVDLSWTAPSGTITKYQVRRGSGDPLVWSAWTDIPNSASLTSHTVTGLTDGTQYSFQIRAVSGTGGSTVLGAMSGAMTATPVAPTPEVSVAIVRGESLTVDSGGALLLPEDVAGGAIPVQFRVSASPTPATDLTVCVNIAETGVDRVAASAEGAKTVTITGGSATVDYPAISWTDDAVDNRDSLVTMTVVAPSDSSCSQTGYTVSSSASSGSFRIQDNERTMLALSSTDMSMTEEDTSDTAVAAVTLGRRLYAGETLVYGVRLSTTTGARLPDGDASTPEDFTVSVSGTGVTATGLGTASPELTFTGHDDNTVQVATLTFTPTAGTDADGADEAVRVGFGSPGSATNVGGGAAGTGSVDLTIDDSVGLVLSATTLTVAEGGSGTYTVALASQPTAEVTVTVGGASGEVTVDTDTTTPGNQNTLTFTTGAWNTAQTVTVSADEDGDTANDSATLTHTAAGGDYAGVTGDSVTVTVTDDDTPGVATATTDGEATEGSTTDTAAFTVNLNTVPSSNVTVTVTAPTGLELDGPDAGSTFGSSEALAFTNSNWSTAQTVTVRATDDSTDSLIGRELTVTYAAASSDTDYSGLSGDAATVTVVDNDATAVTLAGSAGDVVEGGTKDFTVTLNRGLVNGEALPVPLTFGTGSGAATRNTDYTVACPTPLPTGVTCNDLNTAATPTVTFTGPSTGTTATSVTLTLSATTDSTAEASGETVAIGLGTLNANSGTGLGGGASGTDTLADFSITDPDTSVPTVAITGVPDRISGTGDLTATFTFSEDVTGFVTDDVTVTGGTKGTFTATSATVYTLAVTPDGGADVVVTVAADSATDDTNTGPASAETATAVWTALVFSSAAVTVVEEASATYTVALSSQPDGNVTVTVGGASGEVTFDTDSTTPGTQTTALTFTTTNWNMPRTVTVLAAADGDTANDTATLTHTASGGGYGSVTGDVAVTVTDNDTPGLVLDPTSLTVAEGGSGAYTVALATEPTGNVTVTVAGASGDVTVDTNPGMDGDQSTLTFTTGTWSTAQTVTVSAGQDNDTTNDSATLTHSASGGGYGSVTGNVAVTVTDDDTVGVTTAQPTDRQVTEGSATDTATFTVVLNTQPSGGVAVAVTAPAGLELSTGSTFASSAQIGFTNSFWSTPQTVTVRATDDSTDSPLGRELSVTYTTSSQDGSYHNLSGTAATVTVVDNDPTAVALAGAAGDVVEGATKDFTITLNRGLVNGEALPVPLTFTGGATRGTDYTTACPTALPTGVSCANLDSGNAMVTFTGPSTGATARQVTLRLSAAADGAAESGGETVDIGLGALNASSGTGLGGGASGADSLADFRITDNAPPPPAVQTNAAPTVATPIPDQNARVDTAFSYTFPANTFNDADRDPLTYSATGLPAWLGFNPATRTFTGTPAAVGAPAVTVTARDGNGGSVSDTFAIAISAANAAPVLTIRGGSTVTEGAAASFTVTADSAPTSNLTVSRTVADAPGADFLAAEVEGSGTWTFPGGRTSQTFTIATEADSVAEPSGPIRVTLGAGTGYTLGGASTATVTVNDDDGATPPPPQPPSTGGGGGGGTPSLPRSAASVSAGPAVVEGGKALFRITASPAPSGEITVRVRVSATGDFVEAALLGERSVTLSASAPTASLRIATIDDRRNEADGTVTVTLLSGEDYRLSQASAASLAVTDDDTPALVLTPETLTVDEGGSATWTVALATEPAADVTVTVASTNGEVTTARNTLTFTASNWNVAQTVVVSAAQDADAADDRARLDHRASGGGYGSVTGSVAVTVMDDDTPGLVLTPAALTVAEGASATYAVALATEPTGNVTVTVTGTSEVTVDRNALSFSARNWNTAQTVTLFAAPDDDMVNDLATLAHRARGGDYSSVTGSVAVTVTDAGAAVVSAHLARFGRTVAEQALEGIADRLTAPRTPGMEGAFAGRALSFAPAGDGQAVPGPTGSAQGSGDADGLGFTPRGFGDDADHFGESYEAPQTTTMRQALLGSHFTLTGAPDDAGGSAAFWGRAAEGRFEGREDTLSLEGTVTTALLGADYARDDWLFGLALTQSASEGSHAGGARAGDLDASLSAVLPYASVHVTPRLKLWGAAGLGAGEVTLKTQEAHYRADTEWTMAAAGLRSTLLTPPPEGAGPALALTADALWTRTASERARDLAASDSDVTRLRLGLEGRYSLALDGTGQLTPRLEAGMRHDGGDAETGLGVELGGGLAWSAPTLGLTLDVSGRTLIAHDDDDLKDRGLAAAFTFDPRPESARGPSLTLRQDVGDRAEGGLDALFAPDPLADRTGSTATARWTLEGAWGFSALGGRFTASPHVTLGLAPDTRETTLGWRLAPAAPAAPDLTVGVKATRREDDLEAPAHTVGVEATVRW